MDIVSGLFLTVIAVTAGILAVTGILSLAALITIVGLTQFLIGPLQSVTKDAGSWWATATASAARLLDLLREDDDADSPPSAPAGASARPRPVDDASASILDEVLPGQLVAVSADGKTAARLLQNLRRRHPAALIVPHAPHLFAGSVRQNIELPGVDPARADRAVHATGCAELTEILPRGLDSDVAEGGSALSGGQRQRVALARALAQDAPVLVLHDPTTAVDAVTETEIAARLQAIRAGQRTLVITRSPAFRAIADRVITLTDDDGMPR